MTTGSWSVGTNSNTSPLYAEKAWSGADGKYEIWAAGKRLKWNTYHMTHKKWTQSTGGAPGHASEPPVASTQASYKTFVGWTVNDDLRLLNKLAEKIKGHAFDLGINMAEAGRTYGLILKNCQSIGSGLVALKHGQIGDAFSSLGVPRGDWRTLKSKDISGRWLEMQYGWRPLVDQAYEAGKALEAVTKQRSLRFYSSSSKTKESNQSSAPAAYELWVKSTVSTKIYADLYEDISFARSLGLANPSAIAWEVVPYSFVVDWFLPVGSYLSAWGVIPALKGRFLTITKCSTKGCRFVRKAGANPVWKDTSLRYSDLILDRVPSTSLSVPRPTFKRLPQALSPAHLLNAVALVHQRLG